MAPHSKDNRPNVLYLMADQMNARSVLGGALPRKRCSSRRRRVMPMYNDKSTIKMPHIDGLAKNGVVFDSAYTNSPLCAPARFTLCTGQSQEACLFLRSGAGQAACRARLAVSIMRPPWVPTSRPTPTACVTRATTRPYPAKVSSRASSGSRAHARSLQCTL
jgi:hypothetical protein